MQGAEPPPRRYGVDPNMADIQLKHFMIRAIGDEGGEDALNRFLRGHQVLEVRQEFVPNGSNSAWCISPRPRAEDRHEKHTPR